MFQRDFWEELGLGAAWGKEGQGPRGFRWNPFERGDLKFVILRLISQKPMHGYEVMQALEEEAGGWYRASPGSVYPTLQMLEDEGLVHSTEADGKKVYQITPEGEAYLRDNGDLVDRIFRRVETFTDGFFGQHTRELTAAFSRLAQTCFEGAFSGELDQEKVTGMVEILNRARAEMEGVIRSESQEEEDGEEGSGPGDPPERPEENSEPV